LREKKAERSTLGERKRGMGGPNVPFGWEKGDALTFLKGRKNKGGKGKGGREDRLAKCQILTGMEYKKEGSNISSRYLKR